MARRHPPILEAVKVKSPVPRRAQEVTYMVLEPEPAARDKRAERRWRTHLRSGRLVDAQTYIVAESQVRDRSARGVRLRLAGNIRLPERIRFFDDVSKRMFEAQVAWQRGQEIGLSLLREIDASRLSRSELWRLGIKLPRTTG